MLDFIANIIDPIGTIYSDEELRKTFQDGGNMLLLAGKILKKYKQEAIEILSALQGVDAKDFNMNVFEMIKSLAELLQESRVELLTVFTTPEQKTEDTSSGSPTATTEGEGESKNFQDFIKSGIDNM